MQRYNQGAYANFSMRIINSLNELDEIIKELDDAAKVSDDALRALFTTFKFEQQALPNSDPFSMQYNAYQFEIYKRLAGKEYTVANEISTFDVDRAVKMPFPFSSESCGTVGNHIIAIGHLIKTLALKPGSKIIEFGAGWGNTTLWLAQMGFQVTAIDIEQRFIDLIKKRSAAISINIEAITADFQIAHKLDRKWDAIIFFESFHHCADHQNLIPGLLNLLNEGGKIIFAAEPITDDFPIPWGLRLDGESLWAIRNFGWCELGFQETYFRELMSRNNLKITKYSCPETPWGTIFIAERNDDLNLDLPSLDVTPQTHLSTKNSFSILRLLRFIKKKLSFFK